MKASIKTGDKMKKNGIHWGCKGHGTTVRNWQSNNEEIRES
jgi:hypothetical protein